MKKRIVSFALTLAMVLTMMPFLPATVHAAAAPQITISGITPVAGKTPATKENVVQDPDQDYQLKSIKWFDEYDNAFSGEFMPNGDYYVRLTFEGTSAPTADGATITIDGEEYEEDYDCYISTSGNTITYECWFDSDDIKVTDFTIYVANHPDNCIDPGKTTTTYTVKQRKGSGTILYKWYKCDAAGNISGSPIYKNTTGKFTMDNLGYNYGRHYVAIRAIDKNGAGTKSNKIVLQMDVYYNLTKATITVKDRVYNGKSGRTPVITIKAKINGVTKTLVKGTDYTLEYAKAASKRKGVGTYYFTLDGKKYFYYEPKTDLDYNLKFRVNPKGTSLVSVTSKGESFDAKWKKQTTLMPVSAVSGYQIQASWNSKFTKKLTLFPVKGYNKTYARVPNLTPNKKYYVRIRTYKTVNGVKYYSAWSKYKTVTTKDL